MKNILIVLAMSTLVAAAYADPPPPPHFTSLRAEGEGEAWAYGGGSVEWRLSGAGTLEVRETSGNTVTAGGTGARVVRDGTSSFIGYKGTVTVEGDRIACHFVGGSLELKARGDARIILAGTGKYWGDDDGAKQWNPYGETFSLGDPPDTDWDEFIVGDAQYQAQTSAAVREIRSFPAYSRWAVDYPDAAVLLLDTRSYHDWCSLHPTAVAALYAWPGWDTWVVTRPRLCIFVRHHHAYLDWCRRYPTFAVYFWHPTVYYSWARRHPLELSAISVDLSYNDWACRYPAAAAAITTFRSVRIEPERMVSRHGFQFALSLGGRIGSCDVQTTIDLGRVFWSTETRERRVEVAPPAPRPHVIVPAPSGFRPDTRVRTNPPVVIRQPVTPVEHPVVIREPVRPVKPPTVTPTATFPALRTERTGDKDNNAPRNLPPTPKTRTGPGDVPPPVPVQVIPRPQTPRTTPITPNGPAAVPGVRRLDQTSGGDTTIPPSLNPTVPRPAPEVRTHDVRGGGKKH